jgi:hypothetical protein
MKATEAEEQRARTAEQLDNCFRALTQIAEHFNIRLAEADYQTEDDESEYSSSDSDGSGAETEEDAFDLDMAQGRDEDDFDLAMDHGGDESELGSIKDFLAFYGEEDHD